MVFPGPGEDDEGGGGIRQCGGLKQLTQGENENSACQAAGLQKPFAFFCLPVLYEASIYFYCETLWGWEPISVWHLLELSR